ncbi:hypothetical protein [Helicobacter trogontum]|uniref:hypothetical protein n=1 Tax=Helicobacter trogontum TaxID=50960 RepID=UPI000CF1AAC3|nr:hypothetical protein [Helicobacter trogontum]
MDFDFISRIILAAFLTFFVYKIHINYAREIKDARRLREDAQRLRGESQAHLEEARIHLEKAESLLKKVTKLSEDSISTLNEAKKYTTRT